MLHNMPFPFFQRIRIDSSLRLSLSKSGVSVSASPMGAQFTMGISGTRAVAGLPGTGLYDTVLNYHCKLKGLSSSVQRKPIRRA